EPPVAVAETVLHELWHATLFLPGQAAFNESAAMFAGHRGAIAFFCSGPGVDAARCDEARRRWAVTRARARVLGRFAARLRAVYAAALPPRDRERRRAAPPPPPRAGGGRGPPAGRGDAGAPDAPPGPRRPARPAGGAAS